MIVFRAGRIALAALVAALVVLFLPLVDFVVAISHVLLFVRNKFKFEAAIHSVMTSADSHRALAKASHSNSGSEILSLHLVVIKVTPQSRRMLTNLECQSTPMHQT
jgi:hypothetical protein